jgi:predicted enzyme related to lactoylglutathione lyase
MLNMRIVVQFLNGVRVVFCLGKVNPTLVEMGGYLLATTTESDDKGPKNPGAINGGFFEKKDDELNQGPHIVIAVDNIDESIKAVEEAGGKIMGEKMDIPGIGLYVSILDTEGTVVGMLQPSMQQ